MAPNLPVGRSESSVIHKGDLQVGLTYRYAKRDVMRNGTEEVTPMFEKYTTSQAGNINMNFGVSNSLSFSVSAPLIYIDRFTAEPGKEMDNVSSTTFGDLSLMARHFSSPQIFGKPGNLQIGLGASFPTANSKIKDETNQRDNTSGTVNPIISATAAAIVADGTNMFVSLYSRLVLAKSDGREAGDLYSARLGLNKQLFNNKLNGTLRLRWLHIEPDKNDIAPFVVGGATFYSVSPGVSATLVGSGETALRGWVEVDIPFYQNVKGDQLTENWSLSAGLNTGFKLFGHDEKPGPGLHKH